jgi:hypothetical protein
MTGAAVIQVLRLDSCKAEKIGSLVNGRCYEEKENRSTMR